MKRDPLTFMVVCDGCSGQAVVPVSPTRGAGAWAQLATCPRCEGTREVRVTVSPRDPWGALRAIRARPLLVATTTDDPVDGCDAVDELAALRELLDALLAPTVH